MNLSEQIKELLQNRLDTFVKDKSVLISLFGEEQKRSKEYNGRQLLELIQNAEDEVNSAEKGDVLIELTNNKLIVANHGNPFTVKGIQSLMTPNVSPKLKQKNKIGVMGLGFRSILTWAKSITIISNGLSVKFSTEIAVTKLKELYKNNPDLELFVKETTDEIYPIPTLSVPEWINISDSDFKEYDTYIIVEFENSSIEQDVQKQIDSLGPEVLLFLSNLTSINIKSPKTNKKIVRATKSKELNQKVITYNENNVEIGSKEWTIYSFKGELPETLRIQDHKNKYEYELSIAISQTLDDNVNRLFSYFKTDVVFPFPALIHGTFDLTGDRNQLMNNSVNRFLLSKLAELMVNTAIEISKEEVSWKALKLVALNKEANDRLTELNFNGALKKEILSKALFPLNEGRYAKYSERPKSYATNILEILPYNKFKLFGDMLMHTTDYKVKNLITELGEHRYTTSEIVNQINSTNELLSVAERAQLMLFLNRNYSEYLNQVPYNGMPSLILDQNKIAVPGTKNVIMPPERASLTIPEGIEVSFMHKELFDELLKITKKTVGREVVYSINRFNVVEYAFEPVIREIIRLADQSSNNDVSLSVKILTALFTFYKGGILNAEKPQAFPKDVNVTITVKEQKLSLSEMYLGASYPNGYINSIIFASFKEDLLVPHPSQLGLDGEDINQVQSFLLWIGVKEYPLLTKKKIDDQDEKKQYLDFVKSKLNYPVVTEPNKEELSKSDIEALSLGVFDIEVQSIEYLDEILLKNDSEIIITWLLTEPNIASILQTQRESNGTVGFWLYGKQYKRYFKKHEVPSFLLWKISKTPWLMSSSGKKTEPQMLIRDRTFKSFSPLISVPEINYNYPSFKEVKLSPTRIEEVLKIVGTNQGFETLEDSLIYQILLKMEHVFPEGDNSRMIYSQILQTFLNRTINKSSQAAAEFFKKGKVFARMGEVKGYQEVNKVYYMPNSTFCKDVLKKFWIFEMDKRRSKERILEIFGVKPLDVVKFSVKDYSVCEIQEIFEGDLELLKPKLYVYRFEKDSDRSELTSLKKLQIRLCSTIEAEYKKGDDESEKLEINDYEFVQDAISNIYYIKISNAYSRDLSKLKSDVRLAESISDIFNSVLKVIESKKDFIYLFSLSEPQREIVLKSEFGESLQILEEVKNIFGTIRTQEKHFWTALLQACEIDCSNLNIESREELTRAISPCNSQITIDYIQQFADNVDYRNISIPSNYSYLQDIFNKLRLDLEAFNVKTNILIDFTELFLSQLRSIQLSRSVSIHNYVYNKFLNDTIEKQKKIFSLLKKHDQFTDFEIPNSFSFSAEEFYSQWIKTEFNINIKELEHSEEDLTSMELVIRNAGEFLAMNSIGIEIKALHQNLEYCSLLLYKKYEELKAILIENGFSEFKAESAKNEEKFNFDDMLDKAKEVIKKGELGIEDVTITSGASINGGSGRGSKSRRGYGGSYNNSGNEETGALAEAIVVELLKKEYGKENVSWISGNAEKAKAIVSGDDGKGYDIELNNKGEIRYIEVKGTTTENTEFIISSPEVNFGLNKSNYDLILVTRVKSESPKIYRFAQFLMFQDQDTFLDNKKFTVHNESYKVKLNIEGVKPMQLN